MLKLLVAGSTEDLSDCGNDITSSVEVHGPLQPADSDDDSSLSDSHIKARFHARQKALLVTFDDLKGISCYLPLRTMLPCCLTKKALPCHRSLNPSGAEWSRDFIRNQRSVDVGTVSLASHHGHVEPQQAELISAGRFNYGVHCLLFCLVLFLCSTVL